MPLQPPNGQPATFSEPPADLVGTDFEGRYRIEARLGAGGVGVVYRAMDLRLSRPVAIKVLHEHMGVMRSSRKRFEREARALATLTHPHVVGIIDFGVADTTPYLVMELLEGSTLSELLKERAPLQPSRAFQILKQILRGLASVHRHGLAHRDLKPANVFLQPLSDSTEHVKLLDFGLAKYLDPEASENGHSITRAGEIFGTPGYIAPEQIAGTSIDERADIYAVGVILFEMLAGRKPFGEETHELLRHQLVDPVPSLHQACPSRKAVPELENMLQRMLNRKPAERYQSVAELSAVFDALPKPAVLELEEAPNTGEQIGFAPTLLKTESEPPIRLWQRLSERFRSTVGNLVESVQEKIRRLIYAGAFAIAVLSTIVIVVAVAVIYIFKNPELEDQQAALKDAFAGKRNAVDGREGGQSATPKQPLSAEKRGREAADSSEKEGEPQSEVGIPTITPSLANRASPMENIRPPAVDPWAGAVPKNLAKVRKAVREGREMGNRTVAFLRSYRKLRPKDPRGHLLLAGLYLNRNWLRDAVKQYELAFRVDPSCRGDPKILRDLVQLAANRRSSPQASELIRRVYGPEALPALDRALAKYKEDPDAVARLRLLRESLIH